MPEKAFQRRLTFSGDYYSGSPERWKEYWEAVEANNWKRVMELETEQEDDFYWNEWIYHR